MLCSVTIGVKRKYLLYISVMAAYRQYIHESSRPQDPNWLTSSESIPFLLSCSGPCFHHRDSQILGSSSPRLTDAELISSPALLAELVLSLSPLLDALDFSSLTSWMDSAENDSPYWSLNTALLASQPYPLKGLYKSASPGPN